jgi:poly-gamma-glutamate capsule biosynthesis protein CapA/YwtB (metallophosphatase superfamily)
MTKAVQRAGARVRRYLARAALCCALGLPGTPYALGQAPAMNTPAARSHRSWQAETVMKIQAPFTVAAVGDVIIPQPIYDDDPRFQGLIDHIRKADVGFGNMESTLVDFGHFIGPVAGTEAPLRTGQSLEAMGFTLMSRANNHTFDGGVMGMISTDEALDKLGIAHAGTGMDLQQARAARYLETPKGRVGLVSIFSVDDSSHYGPSFDKTLATERNGDIGGAPGADPLHLIAYHVVGPDELQRMEQIARSVYGRRGGSVLPAGDGQPERFKFFDEWYEAGPDPGDIRYAMDPADERGILESIRNGKIYSDFVIVNIHAHQTGSYKRQGIGGVDHSVPAFLIKLAHDSIDNGADLFVVEGMHALRGVEIYKGKPIFYDISNFVFQFGLQFGRGYDILDNERHMSGLENPASEITVLTTSRYDKGKLTEVRLYPVDLGGAQRPISRMGIPLTPAPAQARSILRDMQEYSKPFGTNISIENDVGVIRVRTDGQP